MDWLLVLGLKEGLVECATLCIKSWVILLSLQAISIQKQVKMGRVHKTNKCTVNASIKAAAIKSSGDDCTAWNS